MAEKHKSFLRLLKNKGFQEESMTKVRLDAIGTSTTLESNKSLSVFCLTWRVSLSTVRPGYRGARLWR